MLLNCAYRCFILKQVHYRIKRGHLWDNQFLWDAFFKWQTKFQGISGPWWFNRFFLSTWCFIGTGLHLGGYRMLRRGHVLFGARANTRCFNTVLWDWGAGNSSWGTGRASAGQALSPVISQESTHELGVLGHLCLKCLYSILFSSWV